MARGDLVSVRRALWQFGATAVLTTLVLALGALVLAGKIAKDEAIEDAAQQSSRMAQILGGRNMYADPDHPAHERGLRRLDRLVRERVAEGVVLRVKIWSRDGTVLYSDDPRVMGKRFAMEPQDRALFGTDKAYADTTKLDADENVLDRQLGRDADAVVEVYAGFTSADGQPLVFEAYFPAQDLLQEERALSGQLIPAMVAGPVIASLALAPTVLRLTRTLRTADEQRMKWVQDMFRARTQERRRVARQVHDHVLPGLAAVVLRLETTGQQLARDGSSHAPLLAQTAGDVRDQILRLRDMLTELRTPAVARLGLADALHEQARPLVEAGVDVRIDPIPDDLSEQETQLVYGLAGEGLRNVHRHAEAAEAQVTVRREGHDLIVEVRDDGRGVAELGAVRSDHGLGLLADPLAEIGGELTLRSAGERGALLSIRLPEQRTDDRAKPASS